MASTTPPRKRTRRPAKAETSAPKAGDVEVRQTRRPADQKEISDVHRVIGERITERRLRMGLSTVALAEKAGMSRATLSALEHGRQDVGLSKIVAVAVALKVRPRDLFPS
jgi:ribosome-binding protein aMBF1 (putative translation factor)